MTCAYRLSPTNRSHGYGAVTLATFKVLVSNACPWSVVNTNPWINILTNNSGSGSNLVSYSVTANSLTPFARIGALVVQGQSLVITQDGIACTYSVSPKTTTHGQLINDLLKALAGEPECGIETQWEASCAQCDEAAKKTGGRASVKRGMHNFPQVRNAKGEMEYNPRVKCAVAGHGEMVARPRINRYLALTELK